MNFVSFRLINSLLIFPRYGKYYNNRFFSVDFFFFFFKKKSIKNSEFSSLGPFVCQLNKMEDFKKKHSLDIKWPRLYNVQRMDEASS